MHQKQRNDICALKQGVSVVLLILVAGGARGVQPSESADATVQTSVGVPVGDTKTTALAFRLWRSLTLSQGTTLQDYREPDPLGRVDPLDSETGSIPTTQLTLRWRGQLASALPELVMQAHASYAQGKTAYSGYLQQGITLTPYRARTGNTLQALSLRVGLPLKALTRWPWAQYVAPYAEQSWNRWQRNLTQYGETFAWQGSSFGVMGVWPLAELGLPQLARFTLEADLAAGRSRRAHMAAPELGFASDLGATGTHNVSVALHYAATPTWLFGLRYVAQRNDFAASATMAGLQYPGASYSGHSLFVSVAHTFDSRSSQ